ncbi:M23 family metallopeptidase [Oculatella sp. LEGE 06141]|uniref:M23 family metallopeptidase n=1 Tax=Oculatella sp. LEGE 06141 TaxID=1828648 RepID=UPI001882018B|nr:M23 family metallopeptidase [Oculatella sp. LEGE 06141]MBE9180746.1 M23 family metallopeptidase [Oculatella sp. LEGE 06141]
MTTPHRSRVTRRFTLKQPIFAGLFARLGAYLWLHRVPVGLFLGIGIILSLSTTPAQAIQVQLQPNEPQLGDTISVAIQTTASNSAPPTVSINQNTYPAFPVEANRFRALLPTTPLDQSGRVEIQVNGAGKSQNLAVWLRDRSFPTQRITVSGGGSGGTDYEFDRVDEFKRLVTPEKLWNGPFQRPAAGGVTSEYGVRRYYNGVFAQDYYHRGVDYGGGVGAPVVAPAAGRVALIGRESDGFRLHGNTVGLDHGQGVASIFLHLSRIDVQEGQFVQAGERLGAIGATGSATGPHLHWGLYVHGLAVDPVPWRYDGFD